MTRRARVVLALAVLTLAAQNGCTRREAPVGIGHSYEFVAAPNSTWTEANAAASARTHDGVTGYLATITTADENEFVTSLLPRSLGAEDTLEGAYLGGVRANAGSGPREGWTWVSGEPWAYTNWAPGEPNSLSEKYLAIWRGGARRNRIRGTWNDATDSGLLIAGYVVEYDVAPGSAARTPGIANFLSEREDALHTEAFE
jgi:hypothetical protein